MNMGSRRAAGFSLMEVLVALVILGVGLMGLARLQLTLLAGTTDTAAYDAAVRLANEQVEQLRFVQLSGTRPVTGADEPALQGITFRRTWAVSCDADAYCQAIVTIEWTAPREGSQGGSQTLAINAWMAPDNVAAQGWLVQSGAPGRETLP